MATDVKLSETKLSKVNQSGGFLNVLLGKFADLLLQVAFL